MVKFVVFNEGMSEFFFMSSFNLIENYVEY